MYVRQNPNTFLELKETTAYGFNRVFGVSTGITQAWAGRNH